MGIGSYFGDLDSAKKMSYGDTQRLGDFPQSLDRHGFMPAFNLTDIDGMKIRLLGQLFLRQVGLLAEGTDVPSEISTNIANFGHTADKQEARIMTIA